MQKFLGVLFMVLSFMLTSEASAQRTWSERMQNQERPALLNVGAALSGTNRRDDLNFDNNERQDAIFDGTVSLDLNAEKVQFYWDMSAGYRAFSDSDASGLYLESNARLHLLFLGVSDAVFRMYDTEEISSRALGGLDISVNWGHVAQLDISLGGGVFYEHASNLNDIQAGPQAGLRLALNFWRIESRTSFSYYANLSLDTDSISVGAEDCDIAELECDIDTSGIFDDLINVESHGALLHQTLFLSAWENSQHRIGPELEFRFEQLPYRGRTFWTTAGVRWYYGVPRGARGH